MMEARFGVSVSPATLCRTLKHMECTRQVIRRIALQRNDEMRAKFMAEVSVYDPSLLVWVDESSCNHHNSMCKYSYGLRGIPPQNHRLLVIGTRYSAILVILMEGIHDVYLPEGNVNGEVYCTFCWALSITCFAAIQLDQQTLCRNYGQCCHPSHQ